MISNNSLDSKRPYFENLNGLRFVGAILVLLFHCFSLHREIWGDWFQEDWFQKLYFLSSRGHVGIILFFVLSGFLITHLLLWESDRKGKINILNYLVRRFLRVWPMYFLVVVFGFFIFPHLPYGIETVHELWRFLLFFSNIDEIIHGAHDNINFLSATWTVSVEEQFYLAWGVLIGLVAFRKKSTYLIFFASIILGSLLFRYVNLGDNRTLYFHTLSVMSDLAFGGIIGFLAYQGKIKSFFEKLTRIQILTIYIVFAFILIYEGHIFSGVLFTFERFTPGLIFSFVILEQVYAKRSFIKLDRIPYFFKSGALTYGFYMFHCIYLYYWSIFFDKNELTDSPFYFLLYCLLVFISTYITAWFSLQYYETPFLKLKRYFR